MELRGSWVQVKREENEQVNYGGLIQLPEIRNFDNPEATIVACGPGEMKKDGTREYIFLKPGDKVIIDNCYTDEKNKLPDGTYYVDVSTIECVIEDD